MIKTVSRILILTLFISLFSPAQTLLAWNSTAHRVIAAIAWKHLTPETKHRIMEILMSAPEDSDLLEEHDPEAERPDMYYFMNASYWPDIVRDMDKKQRWETYHKGNWHYIGTYWRQTADGPVDADGQTDEENIVERIQYFRETLSDPAVSSEDKAIQIAWVLHLVGDIHMPLHNTSRVTGKTPDGDQGGNLFALGSRYADNLHWYWDSILDIYRPKQENTEDFTYYMNWVVDITDKYPRSMVAELAEDQSVIRWNEEGQQITRYEVYPGSLKEGTEPSPQYLEKAYLISEKRIALAGYRLAEYLNAIFGDQD